MELVWHPNATCIQHSLSPSLLQLLFAVFVPWRQWAHSSCKSGCIVAAGWRACNFAFRVWCYSLWNGRFHCFQYVLFLKRWRERNYRKKIQLAFPLCFSYTLQINYEYMVYYLLSAFPRCKHTQSLSHLTTSKLFKIALPEASWQNRNFLFFIQLLGVSSWAWYLMSSHLFHFSVCLLQLPFSGNCFSHPAWVYSI